jgi:hypothetical protein
MTSAVSSPALSNASASKVATRAVTAALAAGLSVLAGTVAQASERPEQLVLISFDGAHDNRLWGRSLEMAERSGARFTYFLSCTFLISKDERKAYKAPGHSAGRSNVGFARDTPRYSPGLAISGPPTSQATRSAAMAAAISMANLEQGGQWLAEFASLTPSWKTPGPATVRNRPPAGPEFATGDQGISRALSFDRRRAVTRRCVRTACAMTPAPCLERAGIA